MPYLSINYKRIYYRDTPPANDAPPHSTLLLLHGLGSSHNYYTAVTPFLSSHSYRCISLDTTGSGLSPYTYIPQTLESLATDVIGVMDALGIAKAVVVGHSMSGMTAPYLAVNWSDRINAIVLIGPVYPTEAAMKVFDARIKTIEEKGMDAIADTVPFAAVGLSAKPIHHAMIRTLILGTSKEGYISLCKVIAEAWRRPPEYEKVGCPVLVLAGRDDKSAPLAGCERIMKELGTGEGEKRLVVQEGVGHWHCVEAPGEVGEEIVSFLKEIE